MSLFPNFFKSDKCPNLKEAFGLEKPTFLDQYVAKDIAAEKVDYSRRKPSKLKHGSMAHRLACYMVSLDGNGLTVQQAQAYLATYKLFSNDVAGRLRDAVYYLRHKGLTVREEEYVSENGKKCTRWNPEYDWTLFHEVREELNQ